MVYHLLIVSVSAIAQHKGLSDLAKINIERKILAKDLQLWLMANMGLLYSIKLLVAIQQRPEQIGHICKYMCLCCHGKTENEIYAMPIFCIVIFELLCYALLHYYNIICYHLLSFCIKHESLSTV